MLIPPVLMHLRIGRFGLWLPLFLLWPLLALLEVVLLPVALLVALFGLPWWGWGRARCIALLIPWLMALFASTRGLIVEIGKVVRIKFV